jgi:WD40 repeat protein
MGSVQVYDSRTYQLLWSGQGTGSIIRTLAYGSDAKTLVTGDDRGYVSIWESFNGNSIRDFHVVPGGVQVISQIAFGADRSVLVVLSNRGVISKWNVLTGEIDREIRPAYGYYSGFAFSPDGRFFARMWLSDRDKGGKLQLLTEGDGVLVAESNCPSRYLGCMCFSSDGKYIVTGGQWDTSVVRIWDVDRLVHKAMGDKQ